MIPPYFFCICKEQNFAAIFGKFLAKTLPIRTSERFAEASEGLSGSDIRDICEGSRREAIVANEPEVREALGLAFDFEWSNKNLFFDCKNEIGLRRTYHLAPEGFRSPSEIATHVFMSTKPEVLGNLMTADIVNLVVKADRWYQDDITIMRALRGPLEQASESDTLTDTLTN